MSDYFYICSVKTNINVDIKFDRLKIKNIFLKFKMMLDKIYFLYMRIKNKIECKSIKNKVCISDLPEYIKSLEDDRD